MPDKTYFNAPLGYRLDSCLDVVVRQPSPDGFAPMFMYAALPVGLEPTYERFGPARWAPPGLELPYARAGATSPTPEIALGATPSPFEIAYVGDLVSNWQVQPFIYQDANNAYFVRLRPEWDAKPPKWTGADGVGIDSRLGDAKSFSTGYESSPYVDIVQPAKTVKSSGPETRPRSPAPVRVLDAQSTVGSATGRRARGVEPEAVRVELNYVTSPSTSLRVAAGSDATRTTVVSRDIFVPSPSLTAPSSGVIPIVAPPVERYLFEPFHHPYVCNLVRQLHRYGLDGLRDPSPTSDQPLLRRQALNDVTAGVPSFKGDYDPRVPIAHPYPVKDFDFTPGGAYSVYNWELFFHAPLLIAKRLVADGRYEQAMPWFHAVFHPMERAVPSEPSPARVWKIRPFYEAALGTLYGIDDLLGILSYTGDDPAILAARTGVEDQVAQWRKHPFDPHLLARLRSGTYQRYVVITYIEALIAWGDDLYRRETLETLNEATQLYTLAAKILGRRPERVDRPPPAVPLTPYSFRTLTASTTVDAFSDALVRIETSFPTPMTSPSGDPSTYDIPSSESFVFCVPPNEQLLALWDLVEDRLFKLRHCMTLEGVVRQLPLFEPPIDPALLVQAAAAGVDVSSVLADLSGPLPIRRFRVLVAKAREICEDVRSLGSALLAALEKADAEELAQVRSRQEREILEASRTLRALQIREARTTLAALEQSAASAETRFQYYSKIAKVIPEENDQQRSAEAASSLRVGAHTERAIGSASAMIPQLHVGLSGGPETGGQQFINLYNAFASGMDAAAEDQQIQSVRAAHQAMIERRWAEWKLQESLARIDKQQIEQQKIAQQIRIALAESESELLEQQIDNARDIEDRIRSKYTNQDLYGWMIDQTSVVYRGAYKMAYDLAKQAEKAFHFERADPKRSFIKFGHFEDLKKGLLAGDRLLQDLRAMEVAFLSEDRRELELVRHLSLAELSPTQLIALRETGSCEIDISESMFDQDTPGHYLRRVRSIAVTIPSVTGPYVPVRCTLTLLSSKVRVSSKVDGSGLPLAAELVRSDVAIQQVVTSSGREDPGVFDADGRDERYLPFEGAGIVGRYRLELPTKFPTFDPRTIQDVILHLRYTARDGGQILRDAANKALLRSGGTGSTGALAEDGALSVLISVKSELPDAWHRLFSPPPGTTDLTVAVPLDLQRFPFAYAAYPIHLQKITLVAIVNGTYPSSGNQLHVHVTPPSVTEQALTLATGSSSSIYGTQPHADTSAFDSTALGTLTLAIKRSGGAGDTVDDLHPPLVVNDTAPKQLDPSFFQDLLVVVTYALGVP